MSNYTSSTYTVPKPVLTPEQIQQKQIQAAVKTAIAQSNTARQVEINNLKNLQYLREQEFERRIANLDSQTKEAARQHRQQMRQQSDMFYDKLKQQEVTNEENLASLQKQTAEALKATNQHIENIAKNQQHQIDNINQEIVGINNRFKTENEKAKCLQNELQAALVYVEALQHNKYRPGELKKSNELAEGLSNLNNAGAIIGNAYREILVLNNLAKDIEKARIEYEIKHTTTLQAVEKVLLTMHENRKNTCFTDGNNEILEDENGNPVKVELDFWSEGEYGELEQKVTQLKEKIKNGLTDPNFTTTDLDKALAEIFVADERERQIVVECIMKGVASEARAVQADAVIHCLKKQFYELIERGYENKDQRKGYKVKMKNDTGNTVEILISSKEDDLTKLIVETHDESENYESDALKLQRSKELNNAVIDEGIEGLTVSETKCIAGNESKISKLYDKEAIQKSMQK